MDIFWGLNLFYKRLHDASSGFSGENYRGWLAGTIDDPEKLKLKNIRSVDCSSTTNAAVVLKMLLDKGVRKDKASLEGKHVYIYEDQQ
ncbi:MAG: hypothetical protein JWO09_278 [Bacteroidetes bacterium]|nr:hypothetical protein [Bacteroidota bacterium]